MRTKTIIDGFRNSQKFRIIYKGDGSENDIGMYLTITEMTQIFATVNARAICWDALLKLAYIRAEAKRKGTELPTGLNTTFRNQQVQVDLY